MYDQWENLTAEEWAAVMGRGCLGVTEGKRCGLPARTTMSLLVVTCAPTTGLGRAGLTARQASVQIFTTMASVIPSN
jgi:hypothetical protein